MEVGIGAGDLHRLVPIERVGTGARGLVELHELLSFFVHQPGPSPDFARLLQEGRTRSRRNTPYFAVEFNAAHRLPLYRCAMLRQTSEGEITWNAFPT